MTQKKQMTNPLGTDRISTLVARFAVPSIIATLVSAVYNIADQLFIGSAEHRERKCCNQCRLSALYALRFAGTAFWDRRSIKL